MDASYQIQRAKIAINNGGLIGVGAGKSIMKNHLPQSNSDFIFAIIVEEYGIVGGSLIIILYILMFFRILVITHKAKDKFGKILVSGLGIFIITQAFTNISVATQIIPVTGQNLPLISSGGTSAWMTCISLGMILSVSSSIKNKNDKNRFIISGGGTGGHIYPALSIANEINKSFDNPEIKFIGARGKMEMNIIPKYGYKIHGLLISGLQRSFTLKNILLPFKLIISFIQSIIIILSFRPIFVVGTGGFASFPIVFISSIFKIPTLIQEQNSFPGISNRLLSKYTNYISVAYDKMEKYFPSKKIYKTGNPIRESIKSNKNLVNQRKN